jgi:hypothetical protein
MMFTLMLFACSISDPMKERAEHAALACYDNGALVYASETTVDDLEFLLQQQSECGVVGNNPAPRCLQHACEFTDKGVDFETYDLNCVPRIPSEAYRQYLTKRGKPCPAAATPLPLPSNPPVVPATPDELRADELRAKYGLPPLVRKKAGDDIDLGL